MRHAATLDLADFENAAYYDQLQQAQRESAQRPVQMVSGVFGLGRSIVTFATMVALLLGLSPWVAAAALIAPIPAFISGSRYGWWGFQQMRRQSPVLRVMSYLTTLMTTTSTRRKSSSSRPATTSSTATSGPRPAITRRPASSWSAATWPGSAGAR